MTTARFIVGDSPTVLRGLPDASVDVVITSPPFLALRSYLPDDHPDKAQEMGSEPTPGEFLDALLDVIEECRRLIAPHGSLCVELGDTYSGSGGAGGDYNDTGLRDGQPKFTGSAMSYRKTAQRNRSLADWPEAKSLVLVPETFRFALAYGRNPFTGRTLAPWRIRNVVRWCRPNPPVGALGDKFRPATSEIAVACTSKTRWFDLEAVRSEPSPNTHARTARVGEQRRPNRTPKASAGGNNNRDTLDISNEVHPGGAPPLDWWKVSVRGYPGQHYATYPPQLIEKLIKAMCPQRVCTTCGEPSRRLVEPSKAHAALLGADMFGDHHNDVMRRSAGKSRGDGKGNNRVNAEYETTGWTDCGHDTWRRGVVLDPFAGSGTTLAVATGHGHDAIGIDLDSRNADLAAERVGMFLTVERAEPGGVTCSPHPTAHSCTAPTDSQGSAKPDSNWPEPAPGTAG